MATYTSTQDGNWNTDATWGGGGHPTSNDDIAVIGHDVTYDAGVSAVTWGNITLNSGGMLVFPINASSTIKFNATAILTVNSGGELRTGTTSTVGAVGAAYTLRFEWPQGAAARYVLVLNDGAIVNIRGADVTQYAYLDADWTSGQSFYVEGDYSSLWSAGQTFYIHVNAAYVTDGYKTQGKTYTIGSVGAYDSGNDRTQITISESAPGVAFAALYEGHRSKLILVTRNVVLCDPGESLAVYGYNSYTERIQGDLNQGGTNRIVNFQNCLFYGWEKCFDGGFNLNAEDCIYINNQNVFSAGSNFSVSGYGISVYNFFYNCFNCTLVGDVCSTMTIVYTGGSNIINGSAISALFVSNASQNSMFNSCISNSKVIVGASFCSVIKNGAIIGNTSVFSNGAETLINSNMVGNTTVSELGSKSSVQSCVLEDSTISGADRFPLRVYTNAGNVLPLDSGDTDWQTPESGNSWIMQAVANSYCNFVTRVNQISYSPLRDMATYAPASSTTLTIKIWPVGWTTSLDQDDVVLEVKYLDTASGVTRTTVYNTSQTYANGAWRNCSVTFTQAQAGIVYFNLYFRSYESGAYVLIDPIWSVA